MKGQGQKQFHAERKIIKKALDSLVQKKQQIRIHFLNSSTCQVQKVDLNEHPNADMATLDPSAQEMHTHEASNKEAFMKEADSKISRFPNHKQQLFEVIYRNSSRMQSIGWHEYPPVRRTSNMSRTFRRRRKSNLQDYSTINDHFQLNQDNPSQVLKDNLLAVNNLELSGFTNKEILKKTAKSIEQLQSPRKINQIGKYPHILTFVGQKNFKRAEFILPLSETSKSIFSIASNKLNKKWKFQATPQCSKSARQIINPQTNFAKWDKDNLERRHRQRQLSLAQKGSQSPQHYDHPFLKQLKPSTHVQKKKGYQKRAYSQFIRSRPHHYQNQQGQSIEEGCRPWSVFRNIDEKIDEAKPTLQEPNNE